MPFVLLYLVVEIVALVALVGAIVGRWLARREGLRALRAMAEAARERRVAHVELTDGLLIAVGGLLLIVPGLVTDVAGLLLLLPPTRALVRRRVVRAAERQAPVLRAARIRGGGVVIDGMMADGPVVDGTVVPPRANGSTAALPPVIEGEVVDGPDDRPLAS